jgi:hypothetical protein
MIYKKPHVYIKSEPIDNMSLEVWCEKHLKPILNDLFILNNEEKSNLKDSIFYIYFSVADISLAFTRTFFRFTIEDIIHNDTDKILKRFYDENISYKYEEFSYNEFTVQLVRKDYMYSSFGRIFLYILSLFRVNVHP